MTPLDLLTEKARAVRIEDVLATRGIKLTGRGTNLKGPCPVCGGDDRFGVSLAKQRFLCHKCRIRGDVISLVETLDHVGFKAAVEKLVGQSLPASSVSTPRFPLPPNEPKKVVAGRFDYEDENGILLFQVQRIEYKNPDGSFVLKDGKRKKDFPQRHPDPDRKGAWINNVIGIRRVLYRLPELLEDLALGRAIIITEGERKVDLLRKWNIPATCNPGGAEKWTDDLSRPLAGADAIILPDNDPPGRCHVDRVAASLTAAGARVRVLELPDLPPKGDIVDWARGGGTVERLDDLIEHEAKPWRFRKGEAFEELKRQEPKAQKFRLIPWREITFNAAQEWRVKQLFPAIGTGSIYGGSRAFKSFLLIDVLHHIALGWVWAGRKVEQGTIVYIAAEGAGGMRKRIEGWRTHHKMRLPDDLPFYLIEAAPNLGTGDRDLKELIIAIEAIGVRPAVIGVDTLAQSLGGADENTTGAAQFLANCTALANHFGCFVPHIHHVGLTDDKRPRGWSGLIPGVDVAILSERQEGALAATLTIKKLKDDEDGLKLTVNLMRVVVDEDEDEDEISTLVVDTILPGPIEGSNAPQARAIPRNQRLLMSVIAQAIAESEHAKVIRPFVDGPMVKAVSDETVRCRYYARIAEKAKEGEDPQKLADRQRQAFYSAVKDALKATILMACEWEGERFLWLP